MVRYVQPDELKDLVEVLAPRDCDRGGANRVLQDEIPADDPGDELTHGGVGIGVGAARDRNHGREFRIAESSEGAADSGDDKGEHYRGAGPVGDRGGGPHEESRTDDRADPERDERPGAQRALERALAGGLSIREKAFN